MSELDLVEVFDSENYPQGGEAWFRIRLGLPSGSIFQTIMRADDAKTRTTLLYRLAGEILSGEPAESYQSASMARGNQMEAKLIQRYAFLNAVDVDRVGFVRRTVRSSIGADFAAGCSPDGLVGDDGAVEIKSQKPELLIPLIESGRFPSEHRAQTQGTLWITGRQWCDLVVGYGDFPVTPTFHVTRDEPYIKQLSDAVERFSWEVAELVKRINKKAGRT